MFEFGQNLHNKSAQFGQNKKKDAQFKASKNMKHLRELLLAGKVANQPTSSAPTDNAYISILSQLNDDDDDDDNDTPTPTLTEAVTKKGKHPLKAEGKGKKAKKRKHANDED